MVRSSQGAKGGPRSDSLGRVSGRLPGHSVKKHSETVASPTKSKANELRAQELIMEAGEQAKRKFVNWKRRQQEKLERNTEVLHASEGLQKKVPKQSRKNKRQTNTRKQTTKKGSDELHQNITPFGNKEVVHILY